MMRGMKKAITGLVLGLALMGAGQLRPAQTTSAATIVQSRTYTDSRWASTVFARGHQQITLPYQANYRVNWQAVTRYFFTGLNTLRHLNGLPGVVQADTTGTPVAQARAAAQVAGKLTHSTANPYGENLAFLPDAGSDEETAYLLLMAWFDETDNIVPSGQSGHYGHRANLLATRGHMGLAWNRRTGHVAFEAEKVTNWTDYNRIYDQRTGNRQHGLPVMTFNYVK